MPTALLDEGVNRHTKGSHNDCDCEYCETKRRASFSLPYCLRFMKHETKQAWDDDYDDLRRYARAARRQALRVELKKLKENIL